MIDSSQRQATLTAAKNVRSPIRRYTTCASRDRGYLFALGDPNELGRAGLPRKRREGAVSNGHAGDITKWRLQSNYA